eukprot:1141042-Pelagomonas_calceolata.AAC.10
MHSSLQHLTPGSSGVSSLASQRVLPKCLWKVARRHADFGPDRSRHRGSLRSRAAAETPLGGSSLQGVSPQHAGNGNGEGEGPGPGSGKLHPRDYPKFVQFFRHASPYIAGHRGRTFVIVIPGNPTHVRQRSNDASDYGRGITRCVPLVVYLLTQGRLRKLQARAAAILAWGCWQSSTDLLNAVVPCPCLGTALASRTLKLCHRSLTFNQGIRLYGQAWLHHKGLEAWLASTCKELVQNAVPAAVISDPDSQTVFQSSPLGGTLGFL